jgi:CubicO group peptidase (beta-lactamase class C family)
VEAFVDGLMAEAMGANANSGATVAIVQDGQVLLAKGYGLARLKPEPLAANAETLFQVASISKTPVYIAAMQLVEAGKIKLDDPINQHLPKQLQIPDDGFAEPIRVRDLLAHTPGFEDLALGHLFVDAPERVLPMEQYLIRHRPKRVRPPGALPSYSNYGLALLGAIIAHVSGQSFEDYLEARVLRPLGMARASYRDPMPADVAERLGLPAPLDPAVAGNMTQQLKGAPGAWDTERAEFTAQIAPAGGMKASASDMTAYLTALIDPAVLEAKGVLKAETFRAMIAAPTVKGVGLVHHGFIPYVMPGGRAGFGHGGAMAFGASDLIIVPELGLGIFISTNSRAGFGFAYQFASRLTQGLAPAPEPEVLRSAEITTAAKALAGNWIGTRRAYANSEAALTVINAMTTVKAKDNGDLMIGSPLGGARLFQPIGDGRWRPADQIGWPIIAAPGPDGATVIYSMSGTQARQRAGLFEQPLTVLGAPILAFLTALLALYSWPGKWGSRKKPTSLERYAATTLDLATLGWLAGIGGFFGLALSALPDDGAQLVFTYPGPFVWVAWIIAAAAGLTALAWLGAPAIFANGGWSWWRRIKHGGALLVFTAAAVVFWQLGLVGFRPN